MKGFQIAKTPRGAELVNGRAQYQLISRSIMGVGSGRQGSANAVTWLLALDMGMLWFLWHSL